MRLMRLMRSSHKVRLLLIIMVTVSPPMDRRFMGPIFQKRSVESSRNRMSRHMDRMLRTTTTNQRARRRQRPSCGVRCPKSVQKTRRIQGDTIRRRSLILILLMLTLLMLTLLRRRRRRRRIRRHKIVFSKNASPTGTWARRNMRMRAQAETFKPKPLNLSP